MRERESKRERERAREKEKKRRLNELNERELEAGFGWDLARDQSAQEAWLQLCNSTKVSL